MLLLKDTNPELLEEWDYDKNSILPDNIATFSSKKVWWKCNNGHSWQTKVAGRTRKGSGCPYCFGRYAIAGLNDVFTTHPELEKSWDYEKNCGIDPRCFKAGSEKKVWWKCEKGHSWQTKILNRGSKGRGCPVCGGQKVLKGYNDLASQRKDLLSEWDYENNIYHPSEISVNSNRKVWWKCLACGNSFQTSVYTKAKNGGGCPNCHLRNKTSFPEQAIFYYLKKVFSDTKNGYRNPKLKKMELDIFIPSIRTAIEYDGINWHSAESHVQRDHRKYLICKQNGIKLIRITEGEPMEQVADVIINVPIHYDQVMFDIIFDELNKILGTNIVSNIEKDTLEIKHQYYSQLKRDSLESCYPELAKEWDYENNKGLYPSMFKPNSNDKVNWVCPYGHRYEANISSRTGNGKVGCPICSGHQVLAGFNDLLTHNPDIANEWDYELNGGLKPSEVTWGSGKKVWWKCKNGHRSYKSYIYSRTGKEKTGCPVCSNTVVEEGINDLATTRPDLLAEWDYAKNAIEPTSISAGSNYAAWWVCKNGHSWNEKVGQRSGRQKRNCPYCSKHRVVSGENDLKSLFPEIANEWNYLKNGDLRPEQFLPQSNKNVWWKCCKNHEWKVPIAARQKYGCPYCSGKRVTPGVNDLGTLYPEVVKDWNYQNNGELSPNNCKSASHKEVYWKCHICGFEWKQKIVDKVKRKKSCPHCQ